MPELAVLSIALGLLIAVARGPMVVAPRATLAAYRRVLETDVRVRMLGVGLASLGLGLIVFARGSDAGAARFLFAFGWLLAAIAALFGLILFRSSSDHGGRRPGSCDLLHLSGSARTRFVGWARVSD
jgi:hypothetical protein